MVSVPGVFLRRPLSIFAAGKTTVEFLYRVVGRGTKNLSSLKPGKTIAVLGPLGSGYDLKTASSGCLPLLIAGGTGVASLNFLACKLGREGVLFYGGKTKKDLVAVKNFRKCGWSVEIATEDGSLGYKGFVTDLLSEFLSKESGESYRLYACGPHAMLAKVASIARDNDLPASVSLEEKMACGVGNCQGCAVKTVEGFKMACKDGPVFDAEEIEW